MNTQVNIPKLTIVIPTFNEGKVIGETLDKISAGLGRDLAVLTEIIIIDDGVDDLPLIVEENKPLFLFNSVSVFRNARRLRKGRSIANGFKKARGEIVGFVDADLSVDPSIIQEAVDKINDSVDLFIGSRIDNRIKQDHSIAKSIVALTFAYMCRKILFQNRKVYVDTQCGFKFFKHGIALDLYKDIVSDDGLVDLEILIKADRAGYKIFEKSVPRINDRQSKRKLSSILLRETAQFIRILAKYR